ncbi:unnamed protein product [Prunus brigantina]
MAAEVPKRSLEEYLMFFRHCTKRSAAQWQLVIRRSYPWFQPGYRLFEKEPEEETDRIDFRKKFLSVTLPRDLPYGGGKPPNYHLGAEVYHPNFSKFRNLPISAVALRVLFHGWDSWHVFASSEAKEFMPKSVKEINAQAIEDPSLAREVSGQSVHDGQVIGDLELPSGDDEDDDDDQAESTAAEATPARKKRKEAAPTVTSAEGPSSPSTKSKRPKKRVAGEYVATEGIAAAPSNTSGTDEDLREAFEEVEQEKEMEELEEAADGPQEKAKAEEKEEEIPAEVIAESIALAQKQQEQQEGLMAELTGSELALFEDVKAEHSTATPAAGVQAEVSVTESVDQAIGVPEVGVVMSAAVPEAMVILCLLSVFPLALSILHKANPNSLYDAYPFCPGSRATPSFADPQLANLRPWTRTPTGQIGEVEFYSRYSQVRAVREAIERLKIWRSSSLMRAGGY